MKKLFITSISLLINSFLFLSCAHSVKASVEESVPVSNEKNIVIVAYVTSWSGVIPDASKFTHLNYAFGHVNDTFDGVRIDNPERFKQLVKLKEDFPGLRVLLSIGGWGSGRFSEMAASDSLRKAFAKDCSRLATEYGIDGIDIDWEYPTINWAGISSSPEDTDNFTKLMSDLREALGKEKILTLASSATAKYVDFRAILPYVDFVNLMTYDMSNGEQHHSPLYSSSISPSMTTDKSVKLHLEAGLPSEKIVLGMPFYGRGKNDKETYYCDFKDIKTKEGQYEKWDSISQSPYIADADGNFVFGYDNPRSLAIKCKYILDNKLKGAMYWDYNGDDSLKSLSTTIYKVLNANQ